jgi:hypothetical protein
MRDCDAAGMRKIAAGFADALGRLVDGSAVPVDAGAAAIARPSALSL